MEGGLIDSEKRGWIEAWTEYTPGRGFTYEVVREGGSDYVRNKILRGMLASEQKLIAARQAPARLARVEELRFRGRRDDGRRPAARPAEARQEI